MPNKNGQEHTGRCLECELSVAAGQGDLGRLRGLIDEGADPSSESECNTALFDAVDEGHPRVVTTLVEHGVNLDRPNPMTGDRALWMAIERGDERNAELLVASGARSCLVCLPRLVRQSDDPKRVTLALDCGVDVDGTDPSTGRSALHEAAMYGYAKSAKILIDAGAKADLLDDWGKSPVDLARIGSHLELDALLSRGTQS